MGLWGGADWAFAYLSRGLALRFHIVDHVASAPRYREAEFVGAGAVDTLTFGSKASRVGMSPVRSEGVVEGSRMWGTFVSSEKKLTALAAVMAAANSSAGGAK